MFFSFFFTFCLLLPLAYSAPHQNQTVPSINTSSHACKGVTYTFSGGRFGDNLLAYMHAKWISYTHGIPLLYKPFPYSDQLHMHQIEQPYKGQYPSTFTIKCIDDIPKGLSRASLLILPYFPESLSERTQAQKHGHLWPYISVDWDDPTFHTILKEMVRPQYPIQQLTLPKNHISVACHLRKGGGFDTAHTLHHMALKFPQDNFFISELHWLLHIFPDHSLYVYLFTDDPNPQKIKEKFEKLFSNQPIQFDCRTDTNAHNLHVLDDFFALTQFDCSIHGESNFAICAGKLGNYIYESQPKACHWEGSTLVIDQVTRKIKPRSN